MRSAVGHLFFSVTLGRSSLYGNGHQQDQCLPFHVVETSEMFQSAERTAQAPFEGKTRAYCTRLYIMWRKLQFMTSSKRDKEVPDLNHTDFSD